MTRPELIDHLHDISSREERSLVTIYYIADDIIRCASDTLSNEFQMAAAIHTAIEKEAERQLEGRTL